MNIDIDDITNINYIPIYDCYHQYSYCYSIKNDKMITINKFRRICVELFIPNPLYNYAAWFQNQGCYTLLKIIKGDKIGFLGLKIKKSANI